MSSTLLRRSVHLVKSQASEARIAFMKHFTPIPVMDETYRVFHRVLSLGGIPIYAKRNWDSRLWLILQIFNFTIGLLTFVFTTVFVMVSSNDPILFIEGVAIWTTGVIMFISLGVCLVFRNKFREFLIEMGFRDGISQMPLIDFVSKSERGGKVGELKLLVKNSQEKLLQLTRILLKTYVCSVWLCATMYICDATYKMAMREDESLRLLAFNMWFPWSLDNFNTYVASFIFQIYAGYLCCIAYPGLQSTIVLLVGQSIRQLRILSFIMYNLEDLTKELGGEHRGRKKIYSAFILSQCVDHYIKVKRFSNRLNVICQPFYLVLILVATILVCACSVKIAVSDKLAADTIKYYVHEFCFILVVYMFCFLGQKVENQCEKLNRAVTEKWYIFDKTHKTHVKIFKMAVSNGMPIFIFGSLPLSLSTFTWFIRNGMSFFTLVMSFVDN